MIETLKNWVMDGHFRVTRQNFNTGWSETLVDKPNAIMHQSTEIVARGLSGLANSSISHLYLAYNNDDAYPAVDYAISPSDPAFEKDASTGFLRIPIILPATITAALDGSYRLVTYTVLISQPGSGVIVTGSPNLISGTSDFFEAALVCQTSPSGSISNTTGDRVFSRVAFQRFQYDQAFSLSVSWAIKLALN